MVFYEDFSLSYHKIFKYLLSDGRKYETADVGSSLERVLRYYMIRDRLKMIIFLFETDIFQF